MPLLHIHRDAAVRQWCLAGPFFGHEPFMMTSMRLQSWEVLGSFCCKPANRGRAYTLRAC